MFIFGMEPVNYTTIEWRSHTEGFTNTETQKKQKGADYQKKPATGGLVYKLQSS